MTQPRYFLAVFGEPGSPRKDTIESGVYHPDQRLAPYPPDPGDILVLYCTVGYPGHPMEVPGVGVVLAKDDLTIRYEYLPFIDAIPKGRIDQEFTPEDIVKFKNIRFSTHWLFQISRESFMRTAGEQAIRWP